jgi:type VI secretion system protein ImpE
MNIKTLLDDGNLTAAIDLVTQQVRNSPAQSDLRVSLFELLSLKGDWDRAEKQLDVLLHQDASLQLGIQVYLNIIKAERNRIQLFEKGNPPHFMSEPPAYVDYLLEAINALRGSQFEEALQLMEKAEEERPALSGTLNGKSFKDFRDAYELTAPVLELIIHDKYTWVPWQEIKSVEIQPPHQLRDMLWAPARIEAKTGAVGEVYLHALYPQSSSHSNPQIQLGRMTEWGKVGGEVYIPAGLRLFMVDEQDVPIFEAKSILFSA